MYGFAYKSLCEIDREGLNIQLSKLNQLSLTDFNAIESHFFMAFDFNIYVPEERFTNKIAALEKSAAADVPVQVLCTQSIESATESSDSVSNTDE